MNYTYLVPIILVILLGISLPESLANKALCDIFTVSATENYTCNSKGDVVTFIPENIMTSESDNIKNKILFNSTWGNGDIGQFDFIVFANRTGYFAINGNSGESLSNSNFGTLMDRIMQSHSSIFVKSGTYPLVSTINLKPDLRISLDANTIIQTSYKRISLDSDTIIQVPDKSINLNSDPIILPQDEYNDKLDLQQLNGNEVNISDEDFDLVEEYRKTAEASFDAEDFDEAINYYDKILEIVPTDIDSLNGKAYALENIGKHQEAIPYYDKVLEIDASDIDSLNGKAQALENIGKHEEAITYFDKVLEIDSSDIDALNGKANALENLGNLDEAISNLEKIVEQDNTTVEEEPPVTAKSDGNVSSSATSNDFDQSLLVIVTVFLVILIGIIVMDFIGKKKRNVEKKSQAKVHN